jgi:serine/threonine-protein kinase
MPVSVPESHRYNLEPGFRMDRYELLCVLAQGGMANVWLARLQGKHGFQKLFAIKTILPNIAEDASFKDMFLDEARIAANIDHPNVVHITDVGEDNGVPYLVMDLIEGESLQRLLRACERQGQRIPLGVALRILADACLGLHCAHELKDDAGQLRNVVHRDISPQNILVTSAGVSKVIDFGIAKARDRTTGETSAGTLKGKVTYMPREQALGKEVDRRADTWALGAVLYFMLTGRPPYKEESQLATLQLVMNGAPIPPLPASIPMTMRTIATRALSHDPADRYQTAEELGTALEDAMRRLGVITTHAQVANFMAQRVGDRLEARKQTITKALSEAGNRARAKTELTATEPDADGSGSLNQSLRSPPVAIPTEVVSAPVLMPEAAALDAPADLSASQTTGTLAASTSSFNEFPRRRRWPAFVGVFLVVGVVLGGVGFVVLSTQERAPAVGKGPPPEPTAPPAATESPIATATSSSTASSTGGATTNANAGAAAPPSASPGRKGFQVPPPRFDPPKNTGGGKRHDDEPGF